MNPMTNLIGPHQTDLTAAVGDAIRTVSARARQVPIAPWILLLEELGLDSLDLVAVILQSRTNSRWKSIPTTSPISNASATSSPVSGMSSEPPPEARDRPASVPDFGHDWLVSSWSAVQTPAGAVGFPRSACRWPLTTAAVRNACVGRASLRSPAMTNGII